MTNIQIYSKEWCPFCAKAKGLLAAKGLDYTEIDVTSDLAREREMVERSQRRTVPQIFIAGDSVGGYDDLAHLNATGELDHLLGLASEGKMVNVDDAAFTDPPGLQMLQRVCDESETAIHGGA